MRVSFDYPDDKMLTVDELLFNYNKQRPTSERISKSELLRMLLGLVGQGKLNLEKLVKDK